jgi:hypothetical protein
MININCITMTIMMNMKLAVNKMVMMFEFYKFFIYIFTFMSKNIFRRRLIIYNDAF